MSEANDEKPFHESIVDEINEQPDDWPTGFPDSARMARIIKRTKIPKNHDAIIAAWQARIQRFGINHDFGVVERVQAKKKAAEEAALKKKMEAYAVGKAPPGLADDGSFETPLGVRAHSIVDDKGRTLAVDKATGLLVENFPGV